MISLGQWEALKLSSMLIFILREEMVGKFEVAFTGVLLRAESKEVTGLGI